MVKIRKFNVLWQALHVAAAVPLFCAMPFNALASTDWIEDGLPQPANAQGSVSGRPAHTTANMDQSWEPLQTKDRFSKARLKDEARGTSSPPAKYTGETTSSGGTLLKGQATYCVPSGTPIKMKIATVPEGSLKMEGRDLDGNLLPAKVDQPLTAKTTEDIFVDNNKVIPQGTVFYGKVTKIFPPRRVGRPGSLVLSFDKLVTPDGRQFAFRIEANNKKESTARTKAKGFGIITAHAAGGAIVGALAAYEIMGLKETIALHGYNVAAGAAAGALMGTAVALLRHGPRAVLEPGDDLNMEIDTDMLMPAATAATAKAPNTNFPGLDIKINKTKVKKDGLDGYQLQVNALVTNNTNNRLESIDLFLEDDNGNHYQLVSDEMDEGDMLFTIDPYCEKSVKCDFAIEYPKMKHKLVWLDHKSRQVLYQTKLQ